VKIHEIEKRLKGDEEVITKVFEKWVEIVPNKTFIFYGEENQV
jgi:hypothetical protein